MSTVRAALLKTLKTITFNAGETTKGYDHGSTQLALDDMESSPFSSEVAVFIGDDSPVEPHPYSPTYYSCTPTYEILIAEKRIANVPKFETYAAQFYALLPGSNLGGGAANVLQIQITGEGMVEKVGQIWIKRMSVSVTHLLPITIPADFRINLEKPTITIDSISQGVGSADVSVYCTVVKGTGGLGKRYLTAVDGEGVSLGNYEAATNGGNTIVMHGCANIFSDTDITIYAVVTDQYGACGEATPYKASITLT